MVIRSEIKASTLEQIYDVCNRLFKDKDCFYTEEELEQERKNKDNIFLKRNKEFDDTYNLKKFTQKCKKISQMSCAVWENMV